MIRKLLCILKLFCRFRFYSDPFGAGGKCKFCGRIVDFANRKTLRAYADYVYEKEKNHETTKTHK